MGRLAWTWTSERSVWIDLSGHPDGAVYVGRVAEDLRRRIGKRARSVVPTSSGVLIEFDPAHAITALMRDVEIDFPSPKIPSPGASSSPTFHLIPVCYDARVGEDLSRAASSCGLREDELIEVHKSREYEVQCVGFSPGFGYLGSLDDRIRLPRRDTPRARVPAGSVAIAEKMTAVYPSLSAGGWHLIGRTRAPLFDPARDPVCLLRIGDRVRFEPISYETYMESEHVS